MRTLALTLGLVVLLTGVAAAQVLPVFDTTRLYLTEAQFMGAIQPYQQAISADARNARAHYWLGFAYLAAFRQSGWGSAPYAAGYLSRAVAPLMEALRIDPGMLPAYLTLHEVYALMGDHARANALLDQMVQRTRPGWLGPVR